LGNIQILALHQLHRSAVTEFIEDNLTFATKSVAKCLKQQFRLDDLLALESRFYLLMSQIPPEYITALIDEYGFDLEGKQANGVVATWLEEYETNWIIKAIVEAVFRSVYKVKTVDGILRQWQRQGKPMCNFKPEFERERLRKISDPTDLVEMPPSPKFSQPKPSQRKTIQLPTISPAPETYEPLNPDELEPFHHHHRLGVTTQYARQLHPSGLPQSPVQNFDSHPTESIDNTIDSTAANSPQTLDNRNISNTNVTIDPHQPPRLKLLDTLKRAISGAITREPGGLTTEIEDEIVATTIECEDADSQQITNRSNPGAWRQQANWNRASRNSQ
jgi:hypothetical protein